MGILPNKSSLACANPIYTSYAKSLRICKGEAISLAWGLPKSPSWENKKI